MDFLIYHYSIIVLSGKDSHVKRGRATRQSQVVPVLAESSLFHNSLTASTVSQNFYKSLDQGVQNETAFNVF